MPKSWFRHEGEYYLTKREISHEFKISKEKFNELLRTPQGRRIRALRIYPHLHDNFFECIFNLEDVKNLLKR